VTKQLWIGTALLLAACGGGARSAEPVQPSGSAAATVKSFMQAVADSNVAKMASLWGTASGPASKTNQPADWQRRVAVMQVYLRNHSYRLTSDAPETDQSKHDVQVELKRETCTWSVPFVVIRLGDGSWLVNQVDLTAAGNPARPCQEEAPRDSTRRS
jgi:hypothetical protein